MVNKKEGPVRLLIATHRAHTILHYRLHTYQLIILKVETGDISSMASKSASPAVIKNSDHLSRGPRIVIAVSIRKLSVNMVGAVARIRWGG